MFRSVFADIGDEQSIAASLSTFSWHMTNIVQMDRSLALPALVLLDEVGAGTDPIEGGALGLAIVDHLRTRGAHVVATTHYEQLKSYASTTAGVVCAAFGFDPETFAPTYRLTYGTPGRSLALEIAGRLGLNPAILDEARRNISAREAQLAEHLAKIDADLRSLDHERRLVAREREALGESEIAACRRASRRCATRKSGSVSAPTRRSRRGCAPRSRTSTGSSTDLRRQVERLTRRGEPPRAARRPLSTGEAGTARAEARAALEQVADRLREGAGQSALRRPPPPRARRPGSATACCCAAWAWRAA